MPSIGRRHLRPVEVELRLLDRPPGPTPTSACAVRSAESRVVQLLLADGAFRGEGRVARDVLFALGERRLALAPAAPWAWSRAAWNWRGSISKSGSPVPGRAALLVELLEQVALDLGTDVGVHEAVERADPLADDRHVLLDDGRDLDGRRRRRRRLLPAAGGERTARAASIPEIQPCPGRAIEPTSRLPPTDTQESR